MKKSLVQKLMDDKLNHNTSIKEAGEFSLYKKQSYLDISKEL